MLRDHSLEVTEATRVDGRKNLCPSLRSNPRRSAPPHSTPHRSDSLPYSHLAEDVCGLMRLKEIAYLVYCFIEQVL